MTWTVFEISLLRMWHNKAELLLTFVVPILFFSIFAWIFGARGTDEVPRVRVVLCDEVDSAESQAIVRALVKAEGLIVQQTKGQTEKRLEPRPGQKRNETDATASGRPPIEPSTTSKAKPERRGTVDRDIAEQLVKRGATSAAIVICYASDPVTLDKSNRGTEYKFSDARKLCVEVLTDSFDQVSSKVVAPLVQKVVVTSTSENFVAQSLPNSAVSQANHVAAANSDRTSVQFAMGASTLYASPPFSKLTLPEVSVRDVLGEGKANPIVAMYAAGIAVMFLLFSATTSSGSMLEEKENSTLERLLSSQMTMDHLLLGKWCFLTVLGCAQTTLMFVAGAVFFGLNLMDHLVGFAVMTLTTAGAAASFALMMATLCKSRMQLGWVSTVVILAMSALGGSMVPRYLMGDEIKAVGQFTFNAWALDGFNKVFWRELPLHELRTELMVLASCALVFMMIARLGASRWERA